MKSRADRWATALLPFVATLSSGTNAADQNVGTGVSPVPNTNLTRVTVASGMTAGTSGPTFVTAAPGDVQRIFIVLQNGIIRQLQRGDGPTEHTVFMDIDARVRSVSDEQGLLGLAFGPDFATGGYFYVNYTRNDGDTIVSRFRTLDGTPDTLGDPTSETILFRIDQPSSNHNGGWMGFGADGFLYIAQGDGGGGGDIHGVCGNGQSLATLLGKILRIDPTGTAPTRSPPAIRSRMVRRPATATRSGPTACAIPGEIRSISKTATCTSATWVKDVGRKSTGRRGRARAEKTTAGACSRAATVTTPSRAAARPPPRPVARPRAATRRRWEIRSRAARGFRSGITPRAPGRSAPSSAATSIAVAGCRTSTESTSTATTAPEPCSASSSRAASRRTTRAGPRNWERARPSV